MSAIVTKRARWPAPPPILGRIALVVAGLGVIAMLVALVLNWPSIGADTSQARAQASVDLTTSLTRTAALADGDAQITLTPQRFWQIAGRPTDGLGFGADRAVMFIATENTHSGALPHHLGATLSVDGAAALAPTEVRVIAEATHHRTSALIFGNVPAALLEGDHQFQLLIPLDGSADSVAVQWRTPLSYPNTAGGPFSPTLLLPLFGGLLASMWPCLLQLSAYFLPTVAGLSMAEADQGVKRAPVFRTAVLFTSGIVVVYTLAGAAAGFAAQSLSATTIFDDLRAPITFVAGLFVLGMAVRLAVQARAPLICKMPVLNMAGRFGNGPLGTMALGLAFATGCMTCFGAALVLGMFAYVVTTASPLTGALILFTFSLGIAVPLVIAAIAMAKVLPLLGHLERNARYLSLTSAAIMAAYGVLLISGNTHVISDAIASLGRVL